MKKLSSSFSYFDLNQAITDVHTVRSHDIQFKLFQVIKSMEGALIPTECLQFFRNGVKLYGEALDQGLGHDYFPGLAGEDKRLKFWDNYKRSKLMMSEANSIKIFSLDNYSSYWHVFKQSFDFSFYCDSSLNYYYTPPKGQCFKAHSDPYDLFILQVEGRKRWKVFNKKNDTWDEYLIESGDVLFIPKGVVHEAFTEDAPSGHVTLGFQPLSLLELVSTIKTSKLDPHPLDHVRAAADAESRYLAAIRQFSERFTEYEIALHFINKDIAKMKLDFYLKEGFFSQKDATSLKTFQLNPRAYYKLFQVPGQSGSAYKLLAHGHICEIGESIFNFMEKLEREMVLPADVILKDISKEDLHLLVSTGVLVGT